MLLKYQFRSLYAFGKCWTLQRRLSSKNSKSSYLWSLLRKAFGITQIYQDCFTGAANSVCINSWKSLVLKSQRGTHFAEHLLFSEQRAVAQVEQMIVMTGILFWVGHLAPCTWSGHSRVSKSVYVASLQVSWKCFCSLHLIQQVSSPTAACPKRKKRASSFSLVG